VRYRTVAGASPDSVVRRKPEDLLPAFIDAARQLEREGVSAIATSCGFLARFQADLAAAVRVPVCTSSLMLVPLVHRMLAAKQAVGILTIDATALGPTELRGAGVPADVPTVVAGLEGESEFARAILGDRPTLDVEACRNEHVRVAKRLVEVHPEVGALVLECTNMPPYRRAIQEVTGLPIFDVVHVVTLLHHATALRP
jgi:Asp/Glu/hydantoin racemase